MDSRVCYPGGLPSALQMAAVSGGVGSVTASATGKPKFVGVRLSTTGLSDVLPDRPLTDGEFEELQNSDTFDHVHMGSKLFRRFLRI